MRGLYLSRSFFVRVSRQATHGMDAKPQDLCHEDPPPHSSKPLL